MSMTRIDPVEAARRIRRERYAGARVLFLAGSVMRGEGTPASDLDLVVVYERVPHAYREAFVYEGWPVEAFVHDPETLNYFFQESDRREGVPSLARMVLEGREIPEPGDFSARMKGMAAALIEAGPLRWGEEDVRRARYRLTDAVDDIRHPRAPEELVATGAQLYGLAADFYLRSRNLWAASRKSIPPRLREVDADFAARFCRAFDGLFAGKRPEPVVALVEEMLGPFGGFLFDGYRDDAHADKRLPLDTGGEPA